MAKKVYVYEDGSCRGHDFTNKTVMILDKVVALVKEGLSARKNGENAMEEFIENQIEYNDYLNFNEGVAIAALVKGSDCECDPTCAINARFKELCEGKPFYICNEESTLGFASSKKEAREVCLCADGEEW